MKYDRALREEDKPTQEELWLHIRGVVISSLKEPYDFKGLFKIIGEGHHPYTGQRVHIIAEDSEPFLWRNAIVVGLRNFQDKDFNKLPIYQEYREGVHTWQLKNI